MHIYIYNYIYTYIHIIYIHTNMCCVYMELDVFWLLFAPAGSLLRAQFFKSSWLAEKKSVNGYIPNVVSRISFSWWLYVPKIAFRRRRFDGRFGGLGAGKLHRASRWCPHLSGARMQKSVAVDQQMTNAHWCFGTWMDFDFPYIGNVIIPTDELIFFRGVGIPPTRILLAIINHIITIYQPLLTVYSI